MHTTMAQQGLIMLVVVAVCGLAMLVFWRTQARVPEDQRLELLKFLLRWSALVTMAVLMGHPGLEILLTRIGPGG